MRVKVSVSIDSELAEDLDRLAERLGANRSVTYERCLRAGLAEGREVAQLLESGFVQIIARALARGESPEVQRQLWDTIEHIRDQRRGKAGPKPKGGEAPA
jgi:metal-responsive CopG/Arc/MetJ family transcriptional regulator